MSYYSSGYVEYDNWISNSTPRVGTLSAKNDNIEHPALCICAAEYRGQANQWMYTVCSFNKGARIDKTSNDFYTNWSKFIGSRSSLYYSDDIAYKAGNYPPFNDNPTNLTTSVYVPGTPIENSTPTHGIHKTNLPIFKLTEDKLDGFYNYIDTGDDSGADNYSDIHPWLITFDVYLDGLYPNIYITNDGKVPSNNDMLTVYSVNIKDTTLSDETTFLKSINIDDTPYISYGDYSDANPIGNTTYKLSISMLDESGEYISEGLFEIAKDGTILSATDGISNHITIIFHPNATPSNNPYPDSDDSEWNIKPSTNEFSGANTLTKTYEIDSKGVTDLGIFMWSDTFKDNIFGLVQSPMENIISLKAMPISGEGGAIEKIKIGNVESAIDGKVVKYADGIVHPVGRVTLPRLFKNFIDYTSINITVYLPFIGFKQLDPVLYMNRTLWLDYVYDTIYGNVLAILSVADKNGVKLVHDVYQANCGIDIAVTSTNRGQLESGFLRGALSSVGNFMQGNLLGASGDIYNAMTQQFHSQSNGVGNASLLNKMDMTARLIIKRPQFFEPNNYGHIFGYPCHQYRTLSEFTDEKNNTFVKCENFVCSEIADALDEEKEEIKMLMENGIFA